MSPQLTGNISLSFLLSHSFSSCSLTHSQYSHFHNFCIRMLSVYEWQSMSKRAFVETCVHREILTFNFFYLRKREKKSFECFSLSIINIFMNISKKISFD